jgi:signal transduction histidine kinase
VRIAWRPDRRLVVDGVLALLVSGLTVGLSLPVAQGVGLPLWFGLVAVSVGLTVSLALRRVWATGSFVGGSACMLALVALPNMPGDVPPVLLPCSLIYLVLLYSAVAHTEHSVSLVLCGVLGASLFVVRVTIGYPEPLIDWLTIAILAVGVVGSVLAAWALGRYRRIRVDYVRSLVERAAQVEQLREQQVRDAIAAERRLIAREIHDVAAHSLAVVLAQADTARLIFDRDPEKARVMIGTAVEVGREAMEEMRSMLGVLRAGAENVVSKGDQDLAVLVDTFRSAGADVELVSTGNRQDIGIAQRHAVYRVVQESITNALKHVGPEVKCRVMLDWGSDRLTVSVSDNGPGTTVDLTAGGGYGIVGMAERMRQIGGSFAVHSAPGAGTTVRADFSLCEVRR